MRCPENGEYPRLTREINDMKEKLTLEIEKEPDDAGPKVGVSVTFDIVNGVGSNLSGSVLLVPKSSSYEMLEREVAHVKEELDTLLKKSQQLFEPGQKAKSLKLDDDLGAKEIWDTLSTIEDTESLIKKFNGLSHEKRLEVADYVFMNCNVFSGAAKITGMEIVFKGKGFQSGDSFFVTILGVKEDNQVVDIPIADGDVDQEGNFGAKVGKLARVSALLRVRLGENEKMETIIIVAQPQYQKGVYSQVREYGV